MWGFPFNIYAMAESIDFKFGAQFGWPIRAIIKSTNDKSTPSSRYGSFSTKLGIPFNIFAIPEVAMDVPNKRYYMVVMLKHL